MNESQESGREASPQTAAPELTERKRRMLAEFVEAYLTLDEKQKQEFETLLNTEKYAGVKAMNKTNYEKGLEVGQTKGRLDMLRVMIEARFGRISAAVSERLNQMSAQEISDLGKAIAHAQSFAELGLEK